MDDRVRKTERLIKIWLLLLNNPAGYTAKELAARFSLNIRTIYRDLDALDGELSVPVYPDKSRWKIAEKHMLPPIRFTLPEALNIFLASRLMLRYSQRYDPNLDATFTKLSAVLPPALGEQVRKTMDWMQRLPKDERHLRVLAAVAEAWVSQRSLRIAYRSLPAERATRRLIDPYYIEPAAPGHASYVVAYCHLKDSVRTFKIERIESADVTAEGYAIPPGFDANEFFSSSWGIVVEGEVKTVRLRVIDPEIIRLLEETVWHPSQSLERRDDGSMIMTLTVADTVELCSWILGWGKRVEVLAPPEVRADIVRTAQGMLALYRN